MPDLNLAIALLLGSFIVLLLLRVPISFALIVASLATAIYLGIPLMAVVQQMVQGVRSFSLLAIPFFIIAGEIMGQGGISHRILLFANVLVGRVRGGLAQVNCLDSMFFGGISGSAVADVSSLGTIIIPMMKEKGYDDDFSVALTVTSACQGRNHPAQPQHDHLLPGGGRRVRRPALPGRLHSRHPAGGKPHDPVRLLRDTAQLPQGAQVLPQGRPWSSRRTRSWACSRRCSSWAA